MLISIQMLLFSAK